MRSARIPGTAWTWRHSVLVVGVVLLPLLGLGLGMSTQNDALLVTERFDALIVWTAAVVSAFACYAAWCMRPRLGLAWATIGLAVLGFQELARAAVLLVSPEQVPPVQVLEGDVLPAVVALAVVAFGHHVTDLPDPAATGFGLGALLAAGRLAGLEVSGDVGKHVQSWVLCTVYVAVVMSLAIAVARAGGRGDDPSVPRWVRQRTALAIVMIGGAHLVLYLDDSALARAAVVVADTIGAALLVSTYLAHFLGEVARAGRSHDDLIEDLESAVRVDQVHRARLHEIRSTIAGITFASQLLYSSQEISGRRRIELQDMVIAELGRLERLMALRVAQATGPTGGAGDDPSPTRAIDLDAMIGLIVLSHEARGHQVRWSPSHLRAMAEPDAVAQVVNVLLDNAADHGRSVAEVTVERHGAFVEVVVHDDGPGIDPALRSRLFEWGERGPTSFGQGIGLHIARDLAEQQGGYLRLRETKQSGSTFVLGLPHDLDGTGEPRNGAAYESSLQRDSR